MLRSILLRSGRGGQTGESKYCAELTTFTASRYRARASRLLDRPRSHPSSARRGMFLATKTPDFQTESLPEGLYALPTKKERTTKGTRKTLFVLFVGLGWCGFA